MRRTVRGRKRRAGDDLPPLQTAGQTVMPVEINLQPEGTPGGDANLAQPQFLIDEISNAGT
jgi:hypothetical protein